MLDDASDVPRAVSFTLRAISCIDAPCSSTADAIVAAFSLIRPIVLVMPCIDCAEISLAS